MNLEHASNQLGSRFPSTGNGMSPTAVKLQKQLGDLSLHENRTASLRQGYDNTLVRLRDVCRNYSAVDWGGSDEMPIKSTSVSDTLEFIEILPAKFQDADVVPEPTGTIALEWRKGRFRTLIMSFNGDRTVDFALVLGPTDSKFGKMSMGWRLNIETRSNLHEVFR